MMLVLMMSGAILAHLGLPAEVPEPDPPQPPPDVSPVIDRVG